METVKSKWETILILLTIVGSVVVFINPRFDSLEAKIDANRAAIAANTSAITANASSISRLDNKFNNLADMMIIAHTNGNVSEAKLVAIWERAEKP